VFLAVTLLAVYEIFNFLHLEFTWSATSVASLAGLFTSNECLHCATNNRNTCSTRKQQKSGAAGTGTRIKKGADKGSRNGWSEEAETGTGYMKSRQRQIQVG
jgi:hypothetical protein